MAEPTKALLSTEQLVQVFTLLKGSDIVELKVSVPDAGRRSAVASLGIDPLDAQVRQVAFSDTPERTLNRSGIAADLAFTVGADERVDVPGSWDGSVNRHG